MAKTQNDEFNIEKKKKKTKHVAHKLVPRLRLMAIKRLEISI